MTLTTSHLSPGQRDRLGPAAVLALILAASGMVTMRVAATARQAPADSYYFDGAPIILNRSQTEVVVRFAGGVHTFNRLAQLTTGLQRVSQTSTEGRSFEILSLPAPMDIKGPSRLSTQREPSASAMQLLETLRGDPDVEFVAPVFHYPGTGIRILPSDEIVVRLKAGDGLDDLQGMAASYGLLVDRSLDGTRDQFVLRLIDGKGPSALEISRALFESGRFEWAEPNLIQDYQHFAMPNDPLFGNQWHLNNTGQNGGTVDADADLPEAWNIETGQSSIVIAVLDDGLDKTHEDLAANLFVNAGEIAGNGIDDDANGKIDDVSGWDFSNSDNNVTPTSAEDNHGTAVAGVAAARGNNATGVSGACWTCKILPVKIFEGSYAASSSAIANAITYAARFADVINNSWGGGSPSSAIQTAIQNANATGRGGKGALVLFASGNSASGLGMWTISGFQTRNYGIRLEYSKDSSAASGDDTSWVPWVSLPGGEYVSFSAGMPAGWTTGGDASWTVVTDPIHSDEGLCLSKVAKAGTIGNSQVTYLQVLNKPVTAGSLSVYFWTSSETGYDGLKIRVDLNNDGVFDGSDYSTDLFSGVPAVSTGVSYPAAHPESIAVGASSNRDCRSHYSQYGPELAFVAPSSAGPYNPGVTTTDRTGAPGYNAGGHYTDSFGGTSSATPLASGIAALVLSRSPGLTRSAVLDVLRNTADKVGPEPYVSGRNNRYGYGRLNAYAALVSTSATFGVSPTSWTAPAAGGTQAVVITASSENATWSASSNQSWLTVSAASGTGSGSVTLTAAANETGSSRSATATVAGQSVTVTQSTTPGTTSFTNAAAIVIPSSGAATPYPSAITVSGLSGTVTAVEVQLNGFSHTYPEDVGMVLVAPDGRAFEFMSGVGNGTEVVSLTLTFSSSAASVPGLSLTSGTFQPAVYYEDFFPAPGPETAFQAAAPAGSATFDSVFDGASPNGAWTLYVWDFADGDSGGISGGWTLSLRTTASVMPLVELDGDGRGDVFTYRSASGAWARQIALAGGGFAETTGAWAPGWSILPATFNADALTDLFVYSTTTGQWYQMLNTGSGFSVQATGTWWPGWQKFVMDLDGDGLSDLFLYDPASGVWYRALSTPSGFTYTSGVWNPGWEITPINLNGDAFGDLFLMDRATGRWFWVTGQANGSFAYPVMGYWQTDWAFYPGDFNGDGLGDWFLYRAQAGQYYVALNTGAGYTYANGGGWAAGWTPMVVDWNADGRSDLLLYNKTTTGQWYQLQGDGAGQFTVVGYGWWNPGWDLAPTDFNADGRTDLLFYKPGTGEWYQGWNLTTGTFTYVSGLWQTGLTLVVK